MLGRSSRAEQEDSRRRSGKRGAILAGKRGAILAGKRGVILAGKRGVILAGKRGAILARLCKRRDVLAQNCKTNEGSSRDTKRGAVLA